MITQVVHILPLAKIRRQRFLPVAGTVLVRAGQDVKADDVIARADINAKHITLDIERGLGVPRNKIMDYMKRSIGDDIPEKSVVASRSGMVSRVVRAPQAGKLVAIGGGQVLLQVSNHPFELKSGIPGSVVEITADFGATIQTTGAWIQGVWGNGRLGSGPLQVISEEAGSVLTSAQLDPSFRGGIIMAGHCEEQKVLEMINDMKLRGLILGSIPTRLLAIARKVPYPIIVIDGFGKIPMSDSAYNLLSTNAQREITLNAMIYDRLTGERPEIIIPLTSVDNPPIPINLGRVNAGDRVRILRAPYMGTVGMVNAIFPSSTRFPSGIQTEAAEIIFEDEEKVVVPLANIEVLG